MRRTVHNKTPCLPPSPTPPVCPLPPVCDEDDDDEKKKLQWPRPVNLKNNWKLCRITDPNFFYRTSIFLKYRTLRDRLTINSVP